jgi:molecular chaperone DnaK (HSP70)
VEEITAKDKSMGRAIGIHLGLANTVAAVKEKDPRVLENREGSFQTPSAVGMHKKEFTVGKLAVDLALLSPKETIYPVKGLMGRGFNHQQWQDVRARYPLETLPDVNRTQNEVRLVLDGKEYSLPEILSKILKKVKEDSELRLNDKVEYAVITVPAYFTENKVDTIRNAGELAGLKIQKILDEPTAAAIGFGVDNIGPNDTKAILVYSLGGGTFDVSVLTIAAGTVAPLHIAGDMWLGGDDFDHKIMDYVVEHIESVHSVNFRKDSRFMIKLKKEAEQAKKSLSSMNRTNIILPGMLKNKDGDLIDIEMKLSRTEFERMIAKEVSHSIELLMTALKNVVMTPEEIDHVILVGGSSQIPLVRRSLATLFGGQKLLINVDPMKCVAYGAAILAARLLGETISAPVDVTFKPTHKQDAKDAKREEMKREPTKVFLCHSRCDKPRVRALYHRLLKDGFAPWLDEEDLLPGQDWRREIPAAVRKCDVVVVCLSKASTREGYVQKEIKVALDVADEKPERTIYIIPARLEEEAEVPDRLSRWQWVDLFEQDGYHKLARALAHRAKSIALK